MELRGDFYFKVKEEKNTSVYRAKREGNTFVVSWIENGKKEEFVKYEYDVVLDFIKDKEWEVIDYNIGNEERRKRLESFTIIATCPSCNNASWLRCEDGFECAECGDFAYPEDMTIKTSDEVIE